MGAASDLSQNRETFSQQIQLKVKQVFAKTTFDLKRYELLELNKIMASRLK